MIQRRQTLFLFQLVFLGIALLFVPVCSAVTNTGTFNIFLVPINVGNLSSTAGHMTAIVLNFVGIILASVTIFLYKKRELQIKLCYALLVLWLFLAGMMAFCPFVAKTDTLVSVSNAYFGPIIALVAALAAYLAAKYIKKDIELLKSADRIR